MKGFIPMHDKILVKKVPAELSAGGIALPANAQTGRNTEVGEVVRVGPGRKTEDGKILPMTLKAGDKIMFMKGCGYKLDDSEYLVLHEADAFGIIA